MRFAAALVLSSSLFISNTAFAQDKCQAAKTDLSALLHQQGALEERVRITKKVYDKLRKPQHDPPETIQPGDTPPPPEDPAVVQAAKDNWNAAVDKLIEFHKKHDSKIAELRETIKNTCPQGTPAVSSAACQLNDCGSSAASGSSSLTITVVTDIVSSPIKIEGFLISNTHTKFCKTTDFKPTKGSSGHFEFTCQIANLAAGNWHIVVSSVGVGGMQNQHIECFHPVAVPGAVVVNSAEPQGGGHCE